MHDLNQFLNDFRIFDYQIIKKSFVIFMLLSHFCINASAVPICENSFIIDNYESRNNLVKISKKRYQFFDHNEFQILNEITRHIVKKYPLSDYEYLAIGRSPTPLVALIESQLGQEIRQLPISAFRSHKNKNIVTMSAGMYFQFQNKLIDGVWKKLFYHFTRFLPHPQKLKSKKILLIDFVFTGVSILAVKSYIEKYYEQINRPQKIEIFGLTSSNSVINSGFAKEMEIWQLPENSSLAFRFEKQMFEDYAKIDRFDIYQSSNYTIKESESYEKFKSSVNLQLNIFELNNLIDQELNQN